MKDLSEIAAEVTDIAVASGNDWNAMSDAELLAMGRGIAAATIAFSQHFVGRCGDVATAEDHIRDAMKLPPDVIRRRIAATEEVVNRGEMPNIIQSAAWIASMIQMTQQIEMLMARRVAERGGRLN